MTKTFTELANLIWAVADLLRGDYKQSEYGKVILPFTLLRRLECVLEPPKDGDETGRGAVRRLGERVNSEGNQALEIPMFLVRPE